MKKELLDAIQETKQELEVLLNEGRVMSLEFSNKMCALLNLQDSLIHVLTVNDVVPFSEIPSNEVPANVVPIRKAA